jgi:DNA-directed RNA polymerase subunit RPC12/RpoP
MKCRKCGKDYPSQHYFKTRTICADCYDRLSSDEKKLAHERDDFSLAKEGATTHEVQGHQLKCPICGFDRFWTRRTLMNTPGLTFLGFEWANKQAENYVCNRCSHILWFFIEQ